MMKKVNIKKQIQRADTQYRAGRFEAAAVSYQRILERSPSRTDVLANLGRALYQTNHFEEALPILQKAAGIFPDDPFVICCLADTLQSLRRLKDAVACYQAALSLDQKQIQSWYGMGCAYMGLEEYARAVPYFAKTCQMNPDHAGALHNLAKCLMKLGDIQEAWPLFNRVAEMPVGYPAVEAMAVLAPQNPEMDHALVLDLRKKWATRHLSKTEAIVSATRVSDTSIIRIGYVSSFFHRENYMKPIWGLINRHDRRKFEIHLLSDCPADGIKNGYQAHPQDQYHDITKLTNKEVAQLVASKRIHLLIDLNGYSNVNRLALFNYRPALVNLGWFNMYATTGMDAFDYLIGDEHVIRPDEEAWYTEKILRVSGSYLTYNVFYPVPDVSDSPCETNGYMTFGCLGPLYKIIPHVIGTWSEILKKSPKSHLLLKNGTLGSPMNREWIRKKFSGHGIDPERIHLKGPSPHFEFLQGYSEIDLALDTFPYNGGQTTSEAIWQGVPVITAAGDRWVSRTSASILLNTHLASFVVNDIADYVQKAVDWSTSSDNMKQLVKIRQQARTRLREDVALDANKFTHDMESLYHRIIQQRR